MRDPQMRPPLPWTTPWRGTISRMAVGSGGGIRVGFRSDSAEGRCGPRDVRGGWDLVGW